MSKIITLIRHGEVEEKYQHKYNGWIDIGLSDKGKAQIREIAHRIGTIDHLYSSDLIRCHSTISFFKAKKVTILKELREKFWGENEGLSFDDISEKGIEYHSFKQFITDLGGESLEEFHQRAISIWKKIKGDPLGKIVVLAHGGIIHQIIAFEKKIDIEESYMRYRVGYGETFDIEL